MAKTYRRILIFIVILGVLMGLLGKKFAGGSICEYRTSKEYRVYPDKESV